MTRDPNRRGKKGWEVEQPWGPLTGNQIAAIQERQTHEEEIEKRKQRRKERTDDYFKKVYEWINAIDNNQDG